MILAAGIGAVFAWLAVLTFVVYTTRTHYRRLVTTTKKEHLDEMLNALLETDKRFVQETEHLKKALAAVVEKSRSHVQKVNIVRFNPFEKRGREQSFVISFLDEDKNGIVMNFMYTSDGIRVFTKKVKGGSGDGYDLSEEEQKAVKG